MKKLILLILAMPFLIGAGCTQVVNKQDNLNNVVNKESIIKNIVEQKLETDEEINNKKIGVTEEVEDKFCMTVDDCIIISGGNKSCPSKKAFNKEAVQAHNKYIEETKSSYCTFDIKPPMKSELVCENYQCDIKYIKL
jgi:hypothetical protein